MSALFEGVGTSLKLGREIGRNALGSFRITPRLRPRATGPVRIAFQAYSTHLAQLYRPVTARLAERPDTELSFILLTGRDLSAWGLRGPGFPPLGDHR